MYDTQLVKTNILSPMPLTDDNHFMNLAIKEAEKAAELGEVPVGAVLVDESGNIIASAHNLPISTHNATAHAEVEVLKKAGEITNNYRLPNSTLYVTLEPCPMCAGALVHARVKRVVFAAQDFRTGACGTVLNLHNHESLNHHFSTDFIENPQYIHLLKSFFKVRRS